MTPEQSALIKRLEISNEELAIAAQTCSVEAYVRARVGTHGGSNVFGKGANGKLIRYDDQLQLAWPLAKKRGRK